jgi:isopentenyl diphosphate isomerase/L-lactate dehydrogenase-like FMN-dependent dehydrogenase
MTTPLSELHTVADFRKAARRVMDRVAYDYFAAGSDGQKLRRLNRIAWDELRIRHRVLRDVSNVDTATTLLGLRLRFPAMIAPTAYQGLAHADAELATVRAAAETDVPMVVSTMANTKLEDVAQETRAPKWFQLYCHKERDITEDLIRRAEAAGYDALVVTVDAPVLGRRVADERNRFELPSHLTRANLTQYENIAAVLEGETPGGEGSHLSRIFETRQDAALTWEVLEWIVAMTKLPVLLKGVVRGDDARAAMDAGCAGIIVSNHGGRQLDASAQSARALPEVAHGVGGRGPVLVDGGIEWGADILRALALAGR